MARRKNSADVLAGAPMTQSAGPDSLNVSVRKISNGFVSSVSHEHDGEYKHREKFHFKRPSVHELAGGAREERREPEANHLKGAIALLNRGK